MPLDPVAGVVMTGATLLNTVKVLMTVLVLLQLSLAVKVTSMAPQKEVMMAGLGALSDNVIIPHPLSVAMNAARWALSQLEYCAMAVEHGAMPFCRLLVMTGGVLSGVTVMFCIKVEVLPRSSSATHLRMIEPPVQSTALLVSVNVIVRFVFSPSQLSVASTLAGGGTSVVQETVILEGRDSGSKTGGRTSIKDIVKPNKALLPKLSTA